MDKLLDNIYQRLFQCFGPRNWWPADSSWEVIVGAILTQNVAWKNVEKAIDNLKKLDILELSTMHLVNTDILEEAILPTRYYKAKAKKLKVFTEHIVSKYHGNLNIMLAKDSEALRQELLSLWGIGQETADCIILYASEQPIFVIDAYTIRVLSRLGIVEESVTYQQLQDMFMRFLPQNTKLFNEYHALLVVFANSICKARNPLCESCPMTELCWKRAQDNT